MIETFIKINSFYEYIIILYINLLIKILCQIA